LGYVRHWILTNAQVISVVDMARDLFQPKNDTQTSMLLLRKLTAEQRAEAQQGRLDYPIFMAIAETVGRDKRGNVIYKRDETGEDVLVERTEIVSEFDPVSGASVPRESVVTERLIDDELELVPDAFHSWLMVNG
ncbi:hypothetical protein ACQEUX_19260, partial [Micromonospora sp. CA-259024]